MIVTVGLFPEDAQKKFEIGDILRVQVLIDEKIGENNDAWKFSSDIKEKWFISSGLVVNRDSLKLVTLDNNLTKLEFSAMVHASGQVDVGPVNIIHSPSGKEFLVKGEVIHEVTIQQQPEGAQKENPAEGWLLPALDFGHWNTALVILTSLLTIAIFVYLLKKIYERIPFLNRKLSHKEKALRALNSLQGFARRKRALMLDDWKKFSFELANILRNYNDENLKIDSKDLTDREMLAELDRHNMTSDNQRLIAHILSTITEVRYGRKELSIDLVPSLLLDAQKFVEKSFVDPNQGKKKK